ncbi:MAG: hypothetical protein ACP5SH_13400 [Syntrophobacteraceae bacterium]
MKKGLSLVMLAIIVLIVLYGTVCLFLGNFEGAYATLPFLFIYYVWVVAVKRRKSREETTEDKAPGESNPTR